VGLSHKAPIVSFSLYRYILTSHSRLTWRNEFGSPMHPSRALAGAP